ncbi:hypothetical protein BDN72DRAFT_829823 [Pluteus cervinus]|uniref:Uncharacterized protein n=1 Tax=Pluteus cervinus TaxID=181527 RepID=A0ACD3BFS6_9AGAR|nr:hypothetical protein BDN72DRAFT_829823 [Pluteus cervinus]
MSRIMVEACLMRQDRDRRAILGLTQVCQAWRSIASGTPRLWTEYNLHFKEESLIPVIIQQAVMWLSLSNQLLCSVKINFIDCPAETIPDLTPFSQFFASIGHRLQSLTLGGPYWTHLLKTLPPSLPVLETLRLKLDVKFPILCYSSKARLPQSSCLKHVELQNTHDFFSVSKRLYPSLLPWSQITALSISESNWPAATLYGTLQACSGLVHLQLRWLQWAPDAPVSLLMPSLTKLHIRHPTSGLIPFLDALILPSLTELVIDSLINPFSPSHSESLLHLHRRSPFPLRSLNCKNIPLNSEPFMQFLHRASTLEQLALHNCMASEGLLENLTTSVAEEPILPLLQSINIGPSLVDSSRVNESTVIKFIKSRFWWNDPSRPYPELRHVNFLFSIEADRRGELSARRATWKNSGLDIQDFKKDTAPIYTEHLFPFRISHQDVHDL